MTGVDEVIVGANTSIGVTVRSTTIAGATGNGDWSKCNLLDRVSTAFEA